MFFHRRTVQAPGEQSNTPPVQRILRYEDQGDGAYQFLTQKIGDDVTNAEYLNPCDFLGDSAMKVVEFCLENGLDSELGIFNPNLRPTHQT